jgi:hypothetical protein
VATLAGTQFSVVSGGALCVVGGVVLALAMPAFRNHRASDLPGHETDVEIDPSAVGPLSEGGLTET